LSARDILLVEDNQDHAVLVQAILDYRSLAKRVFVATSVTEAKEYLRGEWPYDDRSRTPVPALIVLDHWLPDGTGLDLLEWLAGEPELREIPVIVFTACRDPEVRRAALARGVVAYHEKPEGFEDLARAIEAVLRPWTVSREGDAGAEAG